MIEENLPLVAYVVNRMTDMLAAGLMDKEDAHSYGVEGLIQAVDNFDVSRGNTFGTFALLRIRGSILDAVRRHDVLPRTLRKKLRDVENANLELANQLGRWPTNKELSLYTQMSVSEVSHVMEHRGTRMFSLEKSMDNDVGQDTVTWDIEDKSERSDPVANLDKQDLLSILERAVGSLSARDRQIVELRYKRSMSISTIGRMLNVSESRVSQLHKRILTILQRQMRAEMDPAA
jgi:RNA polymerase sigma factor for flagellar operon FliA